MSDNLDFDMEVMSGDETGLPSTSSDGESGDDLETEGGSFSKSRVKSALDETSAGESPDDWSLIRLGEIASDTHYGASESAEDFDANKPRYVRIKDIDELGRLKSEEKASLSWEKADGYILEEGDMLFARSGSVGRTYLYDPEDRDCCHGGYTINHKLRSDGVNRRYLHQFTKSPPYWKWIERIARTGAQANINAREYGSLLIPLPPLPEQRKIASVLYAVDQAIQKTEAVIEQARRVKRGLVGDVMTKGIGRDEFKSVHLGPTAFEIPAPWKCPQLEEITHKITDGAHITPDYVEEGVPFLSTKNIDPFEEHFDFSGYERYVTEKDHRKLNEKCNPEMGDVLICRRATIGPAQLVRTDDPFSIFVGLGMIKPRKSVMGEYLEQFFNWEPIIKMLNVKSPGSTMKTLNLSTLRKQRIPLPPLSEQEEIVGILSSVDEEVSNAKQEKKRLGRLKKGLMQDLLTGEVRTAGKAIDLLDEVVSHG